MQHALNWTATLFAAAALLTAGCRDAPQPIENAPAKTDNAHASDEAEYQRLRAEFLTENDRRNRAWEAARADGIDERRWPSFPRLAGIYDEMEALGARGVPGALSFCIYRADDASIVGSPNIQTRRQTSVIRLAELAPDSNEAESVIRWLGDAYPTIGPDCARRTCDLVYERSTKDESRAAALLTRGKIDTGLQIRASHVTRVELSPAVDEVLTRVEHEFPGTRAAHEAGSLRLRLTRLQPDMQAPELDAIDADGRPMRLADERGKVVVLHFWGFW
jgi:hypothetical protein